MKVRKTISLAVGTGLLASAALAPGMVSAQSPAAGGPIHIEVVTHGQSSDPFWSVFINGVNAAAADMAPHGVTVNYSAPMERRSTSTRWPSSSRPPWARTRRAWWSRSRMPRRLVPLSRVR